MFKMKESIQFATAVAMLCTPAMAHDLPDERTTARIDFTKNTITAFSNPCSGLAEAKPCVVSWDADSSNCRVRFTEIVSTYTLTYKQFGRNDRDVRTHVWRGDSCKVNQRHEVSNAVRGGDLAVTFTYRMTNGQSGTSGHNAKILGANPATAAVRADLRNPIYAAFIYHVSKFKQFTAAGYPATSNAFGAFGIGSVDVFSPNELWNWKTNLSARVVLLDDAWSKAKNHPANLRSNGFSVPDFDADQIARQALLSLRGRSYWRPGKNGGWEKAVGDQNFADRVMEIAEEVANGKPPADW